MKRISFILLITTILASSCEHEKDNITNLIFKGPEVQAFGGKANTWVQLKSDGSPERLGITLNDAVLKGVSTGGAKGGMMQEGDVVIPLHSKAMITPFRDIAFDWEPQGHLPVGVYDVPSLAFHFYMITEADRRAILNAPTDIQKVGYYPAPIYLPQAFSPVALHPVEDRPSGGCFGAHWFDITAPEFTNKGLHKHGRMELTMEV